MTYNKRRNVDRISGYRAIQPAYRHLESVASEIGFAVGSLAVIYTPYNNSEKKQFPLMILDPKARNMVPAALAEKIAKAVGVEKFYTVDLSALTAENIRQQNIGTRQFPRYAPGGPEIILTSGDFYWTIDILKLVTLIRTSVDPYIKSYEKWDRAKQSDCSTSIIDPLDDETYKLLDDRADFIDFLKRSINSACFTAVDMDAVIYDPVSLEPQLIVELKKKKVSEFYWKTTKYFGNKCGVPAGIIQHEYEYYVEGFGDKETFIDKFALKTFLKNLLT